MSECSILVFSLPKCWYQVVQQKNSESGPEKVRKRPRCYIRS